MSSELYNINPKKLGFGLMRLPCNGDKVDLEKSGEMIDYFLDQGYTYLDTAYPYHGGQSEEAVKPLVSKKHPRDSYTMATKMPIWLCDSEADMQKYFDIQLERTGLEYFDFYLLHAMSVERVEKADRIGAWDFMKSLKERGLVRHIGFSFHDSAELLDKILTGHPEMEFVQLQINYADWESDNVQSRLCYEVARKHDKPIIIMEPIKGGSLTELTPPARQILADANPDRTPADWALRFVASLDGVMAVLSGMSTMEQMEQNINLFDSIEPLTDADKQVLWSVVDELNKADTVPCTACGYCVESCPKDIQTPDMIRLYNNYKLYNYLPSLATSYSVILREHPSRAQDCIECGSCDAICPQGIAVMDTLKEIADLFDK